MTTALALPISLLDGCPFLDDGFVDRRLLAAVAAVRHVEGEHAGLASGIIEAEAEAWLAPARAFMLRGTRQIPAQPLAPQRLRMIKDVLSELAAVVPAWRLLLELPIRYALLDTANGAISASSRAWPQHILLADEAFSNPAELREQVLHELTHQWLYLVQEVWALQSPGAGTFTLPSGTTGREPAEVLGAALVAATLLRLYRASPGQQPAERLGRLSVYGAGCLALLADRDEELTDAGRQIARRLKEAL
ncbi:hypothetical protein GCM10027176_51440 [Actinoallomurus bryophytorum]|uniref:aKG-HExxH-type peptide beta-hydroxylase n=1 Tax=Actinoallomurus bryophytorum TaxID=1490222 RepID=UPI00114FA068|nr:HEXXH motif-containing putative peptide modification protein [Actinoallomurus bryophytorum]